MTSRSQRLFRAMTSQTLRRTFGTLLVSGQENLEQLPPGGVLVVMNHPSWWDPLVGLQLTRLMDGRDHYSAMDADALERYPVFKRLGFLPVSQGDLRASRQLLRQAKGLISQGGAFWLTAQGHFSEPRQRPLVLHSGAAYLAASMGSGSILPVAIEYGFGVEKQPDIYCRIGVPLLAADLGSQGRAERREAIRGSLEQTMDGLAEIVVSGKRDEFVPLLEGKRGLGGVYDVWLRVRAGLLGRTFASEHRALLTTKEHVSP